MGEEGVRVLVRNRRARYDYTVVETLEAGLVLTGTEIKSIRQGKAHVEESHARVEGNELVLFGMHVSPFAQGNRHNTDPVRPRKLLLKRYEIRRLIGKVQQQGLTLIPLSLYVRRGWAKVELGLVRGKKRHDKRASIAERDAKRDVQRARKGEAQA